MKNQLLSMGKAVRVIEDCQNGRRAAYEDAVKSSRNDLVGFAQRTEVNSPLALMLGTNNFQFNHDHDASDAASLMRQLIQTVLSAPIGPSMPAPYVLVVATPPIREPK